jgi:hypothetical protein
MLTPLRARVTLGVAVTFVLAALISGCGGTTNRGEASPGSAVVTTAKASTSTTTTTPPRNTWDKVVNAAPSAFAGSPKPRDESDPSRPAPAGVYIWNDLSGWHLRAVRNPASPPIEVTVTANEQKESSVKIEKIINSTEPLPPPATTVTVKLPAAATASGFDMSTGFYTNKLSFTVKAGGTPMPAGQIFLGSVPTPATTNPVEFALNNKPH